MLLIVVTLEVDKGKVIVLFDAEPAGLIVNVEAPTVEFPSMPAAMDAYLKETSKKK